MINNVSLTNLYSVNKYISCSFELEGPKERGVCSCNGVSFTHFTGKPWLGFNGLGWYDNCARVLDALTGRFTTPAPRAERYPDQSPYAHCANNPVRFIDPTGRVLEYPSSPSNMSFNYKMRDVRAYVGTDIKEIEEKLRNSPHHFVVYDASREGGGNRIRTILKLFRK